MSTEDPQPSDTGNLSTSSISEEHNRLRKCTPPLRRSPSKSESCSQYHSLEQQQHIKEEPYRSSEQLLRTQKHAKPSLICKFTRKQILALLTLTLAEFINFCSMSMMAPFFPKEATEKGMSTTVSGFVFSFYAFVVFITSPFFGKILPVAGAKFLFMTGMFVAGGCNILFGLLPEIHDYALFATFSFVIRTLEAVGASAYSTASFVYVVEMFPENVSGVLGILETAMGLGMSAGPAIGGMLYSVGGFGLPFYSVGVLMIILIPVTWNMLPSLSSLANDSELASFDKLFKIPSVFVIGAIIVVASNTWSYLDPTLEPHLSRLQLSSYHVGLIFLLLAAVYGIFSPMWGVIADRVDNHWSLMVIGLLFSSIGLLLLGPSPLIEDLIGSSLWLDILGLCIIGIALALTLMPTFKAILKCAEEQGLRKELSTYSLVAGTWSSIYSLGDMTGPILGGMFAEYFGFGMCSTIMAILSIFTALIAAAFFLSRCNHPAKNYDYDENNDTQLRPLSDIQDSYGILQQKSLAIIT